MDIWVEIVGLQDSFLGFLVKSMLENSTPAFRMRTKATPYWRKIQWHSQKYVFSIHGPVKAVKTEVWVLGNFGLPQWAQLEIILGWPVFQHVVWVHVLGLSEVQSFGARDLEDPKGENRAVIPKAAGVEMWMRGLGQSIVACIKIMYACDTHSAELERRIPPNPTPHSTQPHPTPPHRTTPLTTPHSTQPHPTATHCVCFMSSCRCNSITQFADRQIVDVS